MQHAKTCDKVRLIALNSNKLRDTAIALRYEVWQCRQKANTTCCWCKSSAIFLNTNNEARPGINAVLMQGFCSRPIENYWKMLFIKRTKKKRIRLQYENSQDYTRQLLVIVIFYCQNLMQWEFWKTVFLKINA